MESLILALLGFIYFYTLRWNEVDPKKKWIVILGGIVICLWAIRVLWDILIASTSLFGLSQ